jgi:hypothetical protein
VFLKSPGLTPRNRLFGFPLTVNSRLVTREGTEFYLAILRGRKGKSQRRDSIALWMV